MINYELAQKLKESGFPWKKRLLVTGECCDCSFSTTDKDIILYHSDENSCGYRPTLEELIEACGNKFKGVGGIFRDLDGKIVEWSTLAFDKLELGKGVNIEARGSTPSEAVANLWLKLNEKP